MTETIESDVTEIIITAGEPPTGRRWVWRSEPLTEDVVAFGTLPDPRDARIAELETALMHIYTTTDNWDRTCVDRLEAIRNIVHAAVVLSPERDMSITVEELEA